MKDARPSWYTPAVEAFLVHVEREFHVRAFGEELARINQLPYEERRAYLHDMMDHARRRGVRRGDPS